MADWIGGGSSATPTADPTIGTAQSKMADLAGEQWNTFKTQIYPDMQKTAAASQAAWQTAADKQQASLDAAITAQNTRLDAAQKQTSEIAKQQQDRANEQYSLYKTEGLPQLEKLRADAEQYNEPAYQEQMALSAGADVATASENQRQQTMMRQQQYGIDPTSGVAAGQSNANAVMTAAAQAQAQNQTRQAAREIGLQKLSNVYNAYAGFPGQGNAATSLALNASGQGTAAGQASVGNAASGQANVGNVGNISGFNMNNQFGMGNAYNTAANSNMAGWGSIGNLGVQKYQADVGAYKAQQEAESSSSAGFGNLLGTAIGTYAKFGGSDIQIKQNITQIGRLDNGLPLYSFEYKPQFQDECGHGFRIGVMAQDVEKVIPDAVSVHANGYKMVDYGKVLNHGL